MSRHTRCITIALASLAIAAPAASAMVVEPPQASGPAAPTQDLRNPDQRVPGLHASTALAAQPVQRSAPKGSDDGIAPLVYVLPSAALLAALGAATGFAVSTGRFPRSHVRA
ncbi:MAG: hypothetical protein QOK21_560 [Solirubrobacteraceae bacterium]|jgi:hypothetical protein|nr:hypothetical protein [Solirubrobacteraceae bacterium]